MLTRPSNAVSYNKNNKGLRRKKITETFLPHALSFVHTTSTSHDRGGLFVVCHSVGRWFFADTADTGDGRARGVRGRRQRAGVMNESH